MIRFSIVTLLIVLSTATAFAESIGPLMDFGENYNTLSNEIVTPHVPWANPLPGGPIRAFFLVPRDSAREVVELTQRVQMDYDSILFYSYRVELFGHPRDRMDIVGAREEDKTKRLREKLTYPWDVIIIGNVKFNVIPEFARTEIMRRVEQGTPLIYIFPVNSFDAETGKLKPVPFPVPASDLLGILPLGHIPPFKNSSDLTETLARSIKVYQKGKGKIAVVNYPAVKPWAMMCLTPNMPMPAYEYHQALLARLVLSLTGNEPPLQLDEKDVGSYGQARTVMLEGALADEKSLLEISISVKDRENALECKLTDFISWKPDGVKYNYSMPRLKEGGHFIDVIVRQNGKSVGWISRYMETTSPVSVAGIKLDSDYFEKDTPATGSVELNVPLQKNQQLRVYIRDNYGRKASEQVISASEESTLPFSLGAAGSLTVINHLTAEVVSDNVILSRAKAEFSIPDRALPGDYYFVGWGAASDHYYTSRLAAKILRQTGLDAVSGGGFNREGVRGPELFNIRKIPYSWRVGAHYETSVKDGIRKPCLTDPAYLDKEHRTFVNNAAECDKFGVPGYHLGDESYYMLYDPYHGLGSCYSPSCQKSFKELLKKEYGTIDRLNEVWKSSYESWDAVKITKPEDYPTHNDAPRADHLKHIAQKFTGAHKFAVDSIREVDPTARVGLEGLEALDASWGVDWYPLMQIFNLLGAYSYNDWTTKDMNRHCVRSFAKPGTFLGMWYGGYISHRYETIERWFPWYSLFLGFNSIWWYDTGKPGELYNALAPDYSKMQSFQWTMEEIDEIKNGTGKLIMNSDRLNDKVAIHYSYNSFIVETLEIPSTFERRPGMYKKETCAFITLVEDLGLSFNMVATQEIEEGKLRDRGYKILIMPYIQSLTPKETEQIMDFVKNGGMVIADYLTGIRNQHCVLMEKFPIDEMFGIEREPTMGMFQSRIELNKSAGGVNADLVLFDSEIELFSSTTTAKNLGAMCFSMKTGFVNDYGEGKAIYLNFPVDRYVKNRYKGHEKDMLDFFRDLFASGGVEAKVKVVSKSQPLQGTRIVRFANGAMEIVMLYHDFFLENKSKVFAWINFDKESFVYNVRTNEFVGKIGSASRTLHPGKMEVFALLPYKIEEVAPASKAGKVKAGALVELAFKVKASAGKAENHVLRIKVKGPDGKERSYYNKNILAEKGLAKFNIPIALDDQKGRWVVEAQDVISGHKGYGYYFVE